ncbi:hypothetical protein [Methanimicrococcus hongohii]|uniref:hypothetical protein n=1 Tax=Methanimicrococcus hongohii TaxID=3028295 RepID=UPI00292DEFF7|nr:hypothetical protein [Methanimicrococcus sp. Hf6]
MNIFDKNDVSIELKISEKIKNRPSIDEFPKRSGGKEEIEILSIQNKNSKNADF